MTQQMSQDNIQSYLQFLCNITVSRLKLVAIKQLPYQPSVASSHVLDLCSVVLLTVPWCIQKV